MTGLGGKHLRKFTWVKLKVSLRRVYTGVGTPLHEAGEQNVVSAKFKLLEKCLKYMRDIE